MNGAAVPGIETPAGDGPRGDQPPQREGGRRRRRGGRGRGGDRGDRSSNTAGAAQDVAAGIAGGIALEALDTGMEPGESTPEPAMSSAMAPLPADTLAAINGGLSAPSDAEETSVPAFIPVESPTAVGVAEVTLAEATDTMVDTPPLSSEGVDASRADPLPVTPTPDAALTAPIEEVVTASVALVAEPELTVAEAHAANTPDVASLPMPSEAPPAQVATAAESLPANPVEAETAGPQFRATAPAADYFKLFENAVAQKESAPPSADETKPS